MIENLLTVVWALRWLLMPMIIGLLVLLCADAIAQRNEARNQIRRLKRHAYLTDVADPRTASRVVFLLPRAETNSDALDAAMACACAMDPHRTLGGEPA